jgi:hypothetical protein
MTTFRDRAPGSAGRSGPTRGSIPPGKLSLAEILEIFADGGDLPLRFTA